MKSKTTLSVNTGDGTRGGGDTGGALKLSGCPHLGAPNYWTFVHLEKKHVKCYPTVLPEPL